uniref:Uncharacterized protein n=1 Tax=Oryza glumipatula TaxID=40148 RepID=A0A0E0AM33_9ORYZ
MTSGGGVGYGFLVVSSGVRKWRGMMGRGRRGHSLLLRWGSWETPEVVAVAILFLSPGMRDVLAVAELIARVERSPVQSSLPRWGNWGERVGGGKVATQNAV